MNNTEEIEFKHTDKSMLEVRNNGDVYWYKDGEMVKAEVDTDLAKAFAVVVEKASGTEPKVFLEKIRAEGAQAEREIIYEMSKKYEVSLGGIAQFITELGNRLSDQSQR